MQLGELLKKIWIFLKEDTWQSWIVSLVLVIVGIKFVFFPLLSFATGTPLPMVVVESCSMYHEASFDEWWNKNSAWYETKEITESKFKSYPLRGGLNKGDIVFVWGYSEYKMGDIIIFNAGTRYPLIHRIVTLHPTSTKGDHNADQLPNDLENNIQEDQIIGKAVARIPLIGWVKLIFFEFAKPQEQRGFCK